MQLTINGEPRNVSDAGSVEALLRQLELDPRAVVVELNRVIIRRPALASTTLAENDTVEIVHFVGGG